MSNFISKDLAEYYIVKANVFDTLESAHWYLVYSANGDEARMQAAALIDKARRQLLKETMDRAIDKHKPRIANP